MILPEKKEREYRFRLALRMGFPIFSLFLLLIYSRFVSDNSGNIDASFIVEIILLVVFSVYFIFYIIYESFDIKITESVSKTFTREYLYKYLKKELKKYDEYSLVLISVDNLSDINNRYGIKNGDKILREVSLWVVKYLQSKEIYNFPMGHIKGGDFIIGLHGSKEHYSTIVDLMCLKSDDFIIDDIEVKISGAIVDTSFSNKLDYLIEKLFEIQETNRTQKLLIQNDDIIKPDKLESFVLKSLKNRTFVVMSQSVFEGDRSIINECFVKLKASDDSIIHQKSYMKVLNRLNLTVDFDLMILEENIARCNRDSNEIFAMNISPSTLRNKTFITKAKDIIISNRNNTDGRIIFLLNEVEYYSHINKYNSVLKTFRDLGILIAIDRLGSIHTSFLYMRDLDVDIVRFDSYYTKESNFEKYKNIIDGFNIMAHDKGIKTWAKMIESQNIKEQLENLNIDYMQGKYFCDIVKKYEN